MYIRQLVLLIFAICIMSIPSSFAFAQSGGLLFLEKEKYNKIPKKRSILGGNQSPTHATYSDLSPYFPKPGHQYGQKSCVGWAVGYALKTFQEAFERGEPYPEKPFSPSFIYNALKQEVDDDYKCGRGSYLEDALIRLEEIGSVPLSTFPYDPDRCEKPTDSDWLRVSKEYQTSSHRTIGSLLDAKKALSQSFPIVIGIELKPSFNDLKEGQVYKGGAGTGEGHAMIIVGHSDAKNAFKVLNSEGDEFGDDGYIWIDYSLFNKDISEAYVSVDKDTDPEALASISNDGVLADRPLLAGGAGPDKTYGNTYWNNEEIYEEIIAGLRGNVVSQERAAGQTPEGLDYFPVSMWLDIPKNLQDEIKDIEYHFPGFPLTPKIPKEGKANAYFISWKGYGSLSSAYVKVIMNDGRENIIWYPHGQVWRTGSLRNSDKRDTRWYVSKTAFNDRTLPKNCPRGTIPQNNNTCLWVGPGDF